MTTHESVLYNEVMQRCKNLGIYCHHTPDSRRDGPVPGFPDLIIWGPGGILFRELKSEQGRNSRVQIRVQLSLEYAACDECGHVQNVGVWRPDDLKNGIIQRELLRIAGDKP